MGAEEGLLIDYAGVDYDGFLSNMLDNAESLLPEWSDKDNDIDFTKGLLKEFALVGHILRLYINLAVSNSNPETTQVLSGLTRFFRIQNFVPTLTKGTMTDQKFIVDPLATATQDFIIPKGTIVRGDKDAQYITLEDITVLQGEVSAIGGVINGSFFSEQIGIGDGNAFQLIDLNDEKSWFMDMFKIYVNSGSGFEEYTRIDSLLDASPDEKVYQLIVGNDFSPTFKFGDGQIGRKVPVDALVNLETYYGGSGFDGLAVAGSINVMVSNIAEILSTTNVTSATGVSVIPNLPELKQQVIDNMVSNKRLVTKPDCLRFSKQFPGVERCNVVVKNWKAFDVYITAGTGFVMSTAFKDALKSYLELHAVDGLSIAVKDLVVIDIYVSLQIIYKDGYKSKITAMESIIKDNLITQIKLMREGRKLFSGEITSMCGTNLIEGIDINEVTRCTAEAGNLEEISDIPVKIYEALRIEDINLQVTWLSKREAGY